MRGLILNGVGSAHPFLLALSSLLLLLLFDHPDGPSVTLTDTFALQNNVRVRDEPNPNGEVLCDLNKGSVVKALEAQVCGRGVYYCYSPSERVASLQRPTYFTYSLLLITPWVLTPTT